MKNEDRGGPSDFDELLKYANSFESFHPRLAGCQNSKIFKIQKSRFFKFSEKVFGPVDDQGVVHLNKTRYVHRRNFDKLLEYIISFKSFHLCLKSEQLLLLVLSILNILVVYYRFITSADRLWPGASICFPKSRNYIYEEVFTHLMVFSHI